MQTDSSLSRRKRANRPGKHGSSSHRSSRHGHSSSTAPSRSGSVASLHELLGSNVPTESHPMCVLMPFWLHMLCLKRPFVRRAFDSIGDSSALLYRKTDPRLPQACSSHFLPVNFLLRAVPLYRPWRISNKGGHLTTGTLALRANFRCRFSHNDLLQHLTT